MQSKFKILENMIRRIVKEEFSQTQLTSNFYYIGRRSNPQISKPYYIAYGRLSKSDVRKKEDSLGGSKYLTAYKSEFEYESKISNLERAGYRVSRG